MDRSICVYIKLIYQTIPNADVDEADENECQYSLAPNRLI